MMIKCREHLVMQHVPFTVRRSSEDPDSGQREADRAQGKRATTASVDQGAVLFVRFVKVITVMNPLELVELCRATLQALRWASSADAPMTQSLKMKRGARACPCTVAGFLRSL